MSHTPISRSSTPVRRKQPHPKVLPFPDLPVRTSMSREHSRGPSPLASPGLSPGSAYGDSFPIATSSSLGALNTQASSASSSSSPRPMAQSASPSHGSPLDPTTPRPLRPRAQTAAATTVSPQYISRQEGFHPAARPTTPSPQVMPVVATAPIAATVQPPPALSFPPSFPANLPPGAPAPAPVSVMHDTTPPLAAPRPTPPVKKVSNPFKVPQSIAVTPSPPPGALAEHLYRSLKTGACADVRLWVAKWGVGWHVHKMVLVQAGFFHTLFMGGFAEMRGASRSCKGKGRALDVDDEWTGEDIELTFDDPNITRAAFEICLSRLYSPYPQLHFPVSLLPTAAQPLTPSFPPPAPIPSLQDTYNSMTNTMHLATPRLLLSLLTTATYLGQQYVIREVLAILLRTVGPHTVGRYLSCAIGGGCGEEEWTGQDDEGARGMETVARSMSSGFTAQMDVDEWVSEGEADAEMPFPSMAHRASTGSTGSEDGLKVSQSGVDTAAAVSRTASVRSTATVRPDGSTMLGEDRDTSFAAPMPHFYGFVSNKIGEACVCWLTRWGRDVLNAECDMPEQLPGTPRDVPAVWGQGGIPANFVGAILSSDALFVPNEIERYRMARRALDLRRYQWNKLLDEEEAINGAADPATVEGWEEDEREFAKVFASGIYYSHMTFDDLSSISTDIDSMTALPYAPLAVLQAAHWSAADLKARVMNDKGGTTTEDGELGLTQSSTDISAMFSRRRVPRRIPSAGYSVQHSTMSFSSLSMSSAGYQSAASNDTVYHPVPADDTHRIGAGGLLFFNHLAAASSPIPGIPGMPEFGPEWDDDASKNGKPKSLPHSEKTFFGILRGCRRGPEIDAKYREEGGGALIPLPGIDKSREERWSQIEPFRFSVEFWGVDKLAEKERLYSTTHFYAGSYFNVYVSTIRKKDKGVQLGIYLHRQSTREAFPPVSAIPGAGGTSTMTDSPTDTSPGHAAAGAMAIAHPGLPAIYRTFSVSPPSLGSPPATATSLPNVPEANVENGTYLDPRDVTKAYFSISCASALGSALVRFSSAPDSFALSQSWGWKSSALRSEEYLSVPIPSDGKDTESVLGWVGESPEGGSLRATVVVGII